VAPALRSALREDYGAAALRADLMAGAVVGVVALPLSMALAIASGVPPQHGLYTAIVAGFTLPWYALWSMPVAAMASRRAVAVLTALHGAIVLAAYEVATATAPIALEATNCPFQ
jgi:MFS superfamily sulfate permease-like transporter